jgi:hypothetical protein
MYVMTMSTLLHVILTAPQGLGAQLGKAKLGMVR